MQCVHEALEREAESTHVVCAAVVARTARSTLLPGPASDASQRPRVPTQEASALIPHFTSVETELQPRLSLVILWAPPTTGPHRLCDLLSRPQIGTHTTA